MKLTGNLFILTTLALAVNAKSLDAARANLFKQMDFAAEKYYDTKGQLKDDFLSSWTNSQVKEWADAHGLKAPQPSKKDELTAFARRHSKLLQDDIEQYQKHVEKARTKFHKQVDLANAELYDKGGKIKDNVFETWSDSQLKAFADMHGLEVPQASKKDEVKKFARRNKKLLQKDVDDYVKEASKTASPYLTKATEAVAQAGTDLFDNSVEMWQESRLRQFLDARGITTPATNRAKLLQLVKQNRKSAASYFGTWSMENWSTEDLQKWLEKQGSKAQGTRDELLKSGADYLNKAKADGADAYNTAIDALSKGATEYKHNTFEKWSDSDLKAYLDTYGIKTYQGTKRNELLAQVRSQYKLFTHGADPDSWARVKDSFISGGGEMLNHLNHHGNNFLSWGSHKAKEAYYKAMGAAESVKADL